MSFVYNQRCSMAAMRIRYKLLISFLCIGITLIALIGWISYNHSTKALTNASLESLKSIREMKQRQIERYFDQIRQQCLALARVDTTVRAMKAFKDAFYKVKDELKVTKEQLEQYKKALKEHYEQTVLKKFNTLNDAPLTFEDLAPRDDNALILQYLYIIKYKAALGTTKLEAIKALDASTYAQVFSHYAPIFAYLTERLKIYDIYLIDLETGYVVFETVNLGDQALEIDFANSVTDGGLKDTNLADALGSIKDAPEKTASRLVDFEFYVPSFGTPNAFMAVPIFEGDKKVGALAFELSVDEINSIMTDNRRWKDIGLGTTGESYLIGSDYKMRSISRLLVENPTEYFKVLGSLGVSRSTIDKIRLYNTSILLQDITTVQAESALRGESGVIIAPDYRGVQALTAYAPLSIPDVRWGIVSKIDAREALAPVAYLARLLLTVALLLLLFLGLCIIPLSGWVTNPIKRLSKTMAEIAQSSTADQVYIVPPTHGELGILTEHINTYFKRVFSTWQQLKHMTALLAHTIHALADHVHALQNIQQVKQHVYDTQALLTALRQDLSQLEQHRKQSLEQLNKLSYTGADARRAAYFASIETKKESFENYTGQMHDLLQQITDSVQILLQNYTLDRQIHENTVLCTERLTIKIHDIQASLEKLMRDLEKVEKLITQLFDVQAQLKHLEQIK